VNHSDRHSIELHIEELVLQGVSPLHRHRIGEAARRELGRLLASGELQAHARQPEVDHSDGGALQVRARREPEQIGVQIAQAVHRAITAHTPANKRGEER
jgi:hypothetical protein